MRKRNCERGILTTGIIGILTLLVQVFSPCSARSEIVISEIMYNPAGTDADPAASPPFNREWVEIYNSGSAAVDLSGWQLGDSQDGDWAQALPAGLQLRPHQALVVTPDAATFDSQWGSGKNRIQVNGFPSLANTPSPTNETVALRDNLGALRDAVNYDDTNGWTVLDGSTGASIFTVPAGLDASANDVGTNWKPSMWGVYGGQYRSVGGSNHASPGFVDAVPQAPFAPSPDAAWSMVVVPDTQNYVKSTEHRGKLDQMTQWIRDHREEYKIQLVLQEGDIVNNNNTNSPTSGDQTGTEQWQNARNSFSILNGQVPYIMAAGNHDYGSTDAQDRSTRFNNFFKAADNPLVDPAKGGILQGTMEPGHLQNACYAMTAPDGRKLLVFSLEWGPRQAVVNWANSIAGLPEFADHTAILLTHAYMNHDETRYDWTVSQDGGNPHAYPTAYDTNDGQELWDELVKLHGNFAMTLNGHVGGDGVAYLASTGDEGNTVHQMLLNTQFETNGGNGWLRVFEFLNDGVTVRVRTYSPYHDLYRTDAANSFEFQIAPFLADTGDFDGNGIVDAADYTIWRDQQGASGNNLAADGDHNQVVDATDYEIWRQRFGQSTGDGAGSAGAANVPEPGTAAVAGLAMLLIAGAPLLSRVLRHTVN
ncbi:MAG: lamin tail domain-containing protein [Pirellulales bacterium]